MPNLAKYLSKCTGNTWRIAEMCVFKSGNCMCPLVKLVIDIIHVSCPSSGPWEQSPWAEGLKIKMSIFPLEGPHGSISYCSTSTICRPQSGLCLQEHELITQAHTHTHTHTHTHQLNYSHFLSEGATCSFHTLPFKSLGSVELKKKWIKNTMKHKYCEILLQFNWTVFYVNTL